MPESAPSAAVEAAVNHLRQAHQRLLQEAEGVVIGQRAVLEQILVALFAQGHCLLIGAPGLAKTLMVRVLANTLDLGHKRIQFTPDLMPADITGTDILEEDPVTRERRFRFQQGPVFTNLLLADEINRTPPKTQAALLEAMQERHVTAAGTTYPLPTPFFVLATQNPIEQEGTYPLPEAQLDRFMFCIHLDYPTVEDEARILLETTRDQSATVSKVLDAASVLRCQKLVRQVPVSTHVARYAADPSARADFAADADLAGRIAVPVLTVHAIDDPTAFVELESGIDGLIHNSELSYARIKHPSEVVKIGDIVQVEVMKFDPDAKKVSLSLKHALPDPWVEHADKLVEGQRLIAQVVKVTPNYLLVEIIPGVLAMVPKGEFEPSIQYSPGQEVEVTLLTINHATRRITGSIQHVADIPPEELEAYTADGDLGSIGASMEPAPAE